MLQIKDSGRWPESFFFGSLARQLVLALVAGLLCLIPFLPGLSGTFILDDLGNLQGARAQSGTLLHFADAIVGNESGALRRPISNLSFVLTAHFMGLTAYDYKLVNLCIHLINGLLVWILATRIVRLLAPELKPYGPHVIAGFAAIVWMIHPLQVSTVLYAVQRMTQLSALFLFSALIVAIGSLQRLETKQRLSDLWPPFLIVSVLALLSVLSKENGAIFPLLLFVIVFCASKTTRSAFAKAPLARLFLGATILLPVMAGALALLFLFPTLTEAYISRDFTLGERLLTQPFVLGHYIYTILIPDVSRMGLYLDDFTIRRANQVYPWIALACTFTLIGGALAARRHTPILSFGILWFFSAHAIESTFLPLEMAFEHRNHVAMLGPIIAFAYYGARSISRLNSRERIAFVSVPLLLLFSQTLHRAHTWSSNELFIKNEIANHPNALRAISHAATFAADSGDIHAAANLMQRAQDLAPKNFWYASMSINLNCGGASTPIDWKRLVRLAAQRPNQLGIDSSMKFLVDLLTAGRCPSVDPASVDALLKDLVVATAGVSDKQVLERLLMLRYRMSIHRGVTGSTAEEFLQAAIEINPSGIEALEVRAYLALNSGRVDDARRLTNALEARISSHRRKTLRYKINDLRSALAAESAANK